MLLQVSELAAVLAEIVGWLGVIDHELEPLEIVRQRLASLEADDVASLDELGPRAPRRRRPVLVPADRDPTELVAMKALVLGPGLGRRREERGHQRYPHSRSGGSRRCSRAARSMTTSR